MTVEPIRDKAKIKQMYLYLNEKNSKYGLLFKFGLNTGLRISDLLPIRVKDIFNSHGDNIAISNNIFLKKDQYYISAAEKWVKKLDDHPNHILNFLLKSKETLFYDSRNSLFKTYFPLIENINREIYIPIFQSANNNESDSLIGCIYIAAFDIDKLVTLEHLNENKVNNLIYILSKLCEIRGLRYHESELILSLITMMSEITLKINPLTVLHPYFVAQLSMSIAKSLELDDHTVEQVYLASLLHDIGKIYIDNNILNKKTLLADEEYAILKNHSIYSANMVRSVAQLERLAPLVKYHHERYDGKGYPDSLSGTEIPLESRIISVADAIDAMLSQRVYKPARNIDFVINELIKNKGKQFDPEIAEVAVNILSGSPEDFLGVSVNTLMWCVLTLSTPQGNYSISGTLVKYYFGHLFKSNQFNFSSHFDISKVIKAKISIPKNYTHFEECEVKIKSFQDHQLYISDFKHMFLDNLSILKSC